MHNIRMIAPCGMNCSICIAYMRTKKPCPGCWSENGKPHHCANCRIKKCDQLSITQTIFCYECSKFPCTRLKSLDKRYRTKYKTSLIKNLEDIREYGYDKFVLHEKEKWICLECGNRLCIHRDICLTCSKGIIV